MKRILDYILLQKISETRRSIIFRGKKENDDRTVIIKILNNEHPTPAEVFRFRQEYSHIKELNLDGIVKTHEIISHSGGFALILEDFGGIPLSSYIQNNRPSISQFLDIAVTIAEILGEIHKKNIIHKDLKPQNILINPETEEVKIVDFGISSEFTHEHDAIDTPEVVEGTLAYMSPEQTGRVNRQIDYRTDLYSLGITYYEMLTGIVPFRSSDPVEVIHSHIARMPVPPLELNLSVPRIISEIVMKLLAKSPEDRYQSSSGVAFDLSECRSKMDDKGWIESFQLATRDFLERLVLPSRLYGRDDEIALIKNEWSCAVKGGKGMILVHGPSGAGKTSLLREIRSVLPAEKGFMLSGAHEELSSEMPYSSIGDAFNGLVREILAGRQDAIETWKAKIFKALGLSGRIITDVVPELKKIIGEQPELPALGMEEALQRFAYTFTRFFSVFCSQDHPVALHLDNLHLADGATIGLLQHVLLSPSISHLLIIGSYRDDQDGRSQLILKTGSILKESGIPVHDLPLPPFSPALIGQMLGQILHRSDGETESLAMLIFRKTGGNPLFVIQFIQAIYKEGHLSIDPEKGWTWNSQAVREMQVTENIIDLMVRKISILPAATRELLTHASCIGYMFDLETVAAISGKPLTEILVSLSPALEDTLVIFQNSLLQFYHNRIREAAYSLIPENRAKDLHLAIGRILRDSGGEDAGDDHLFSVVYQLNRGRDLIDSAEERYGLANLNRRAAATSHLYAAYDTALSLVKTGMELLGDESWESHYELSFNLHFLRAQCEYITTNFKESERFFDIILLHARSTSEKMRIYIQKSLLYFGMGTHKKGIAETIKGLRLYGVRLPIRPSRARIFAEVIKARILRLLRPIESLADLPTLTSVDKKAVIELLFHVCHSSYFVDLNLMFLAVMKIVNLSLRYGNSSFTAFAYGWYGLLQGAVFGDFGKGYRFGRLAIALNQKYYNPQIHYKTSSTFGLFLNHWKRHAATNMEFFGNNYTVAQEAGDLPYVGYIASWITWNSFVTGENVAAFQERCAGYLDFFKRFQSGNELITYPTIGYLRSLLEKAEPPYSFSHGSFDESIFLKTKNRTILYSYNMQKCHLHLIFGDYRGALAFSESMKKNLSGAIGICTYPEYFFYSSLAMSGLYPWAEKREKRRFRKSIHKNIKRFAVWDALCPENFHHKHMLLRAEWARCTGDRAAAMDLYDAAIESTREGGFVQNEAFACETAAGFYREIGKINISRTYLIEARNAYLQWGATAKVRAMDENYSELSLVTDRESRGDTRTGTAKESTSSVSTLKDLDIISVLRASE